MSGEKPHDNSSTNERRRAVALRYQPGNDDAPKVVATGSGHIAQRILELAEEHGVHVHEDPGLAGILGRMDLGAEVPAELYQAVAEVLAYVYRINERFGKTHGP